MNGQTDGRRRTVTDHNSSSEAFGSGKLIIIRIIIIKRLNVKDNSKRKFLFRE